MTIGLRTKILFMFGLLIVISVGNFGVFLMQEKSAAEQQFWVLHTHLVIEEGETFLGHIRDAETGQRGFLLVGEEAYLDPYTIGVEMARTKLDLLKELTSDNPAQQEKLNTIQEHMSQKFAELARTIELARQGHRDQALAIVESNEGKQIMDALREHIGEFTAEEERLLVLREAQFEALRNNLRFYFYVEALLMVSLILVSGFVLQRTFVRPISILTKNAQRLAAGEDIEDISVKGGDEVGELARAFINMHHEVQDRVSELKNQAHFDQAFSHAVTACSSSRDLTKALSDALIVHALHHRSPLGAVYLYDADTDQLHLAVTHGTSKDVAETVPSKTGLVGQVFTANEPMVVGAESAEGFHIDAGLAQLSPRAVVLQPINYAGERLGVLVLVYTIDPKERDLLYTANLADQFGITVVGARQYETLQQLTQQLEESRRKVVVERDEAVQQSVTDPLTGLNNRGFMEIEAERLMQLSTRHGHDLALIILDIDHFKKVNDTLGHQAGDEVLKAMSAVITRETRTSDLLIRYGGEEFIVILPETHQDEAKDVAEKLRTAVGATDIPAMGGKNITISLGVAMRGKGDDDIDAVIARADAALYRAKNEGRNRVCLAHD
ncbi:diguanylate cyclase [Pseudomonadota bacterium]